MYEKAIFHLIGHKIVDVRRMTDKEFDENKHVDYDFNLLRPFIMVLDSGFKIRVEYVMAPERVGAK